MLTRISHLMQNFTTSHRPILWLAWWWWVTSFATNLFFAYLPIMLSLQFGESVAGISIWALLLISVLVFPLSWELSNRIWTLKIIRAYTIFFWVGALLRLLFPYEARAMWTALVLFHIWLWCNLIQRYVLSLAEKNEGWMMFWLVESIIATWTFIATLVFPYFELYAYPSIPSFIVLSMLILLTITYILPDTLQPQQAQETLSLPQLFHLKDYIRKWRNFIHTNDDYPLFYLSVRFFEWIFYGTIRFLFPLYVIHEHAWISRTEGLTLWIYEIITMLFWWVCGLLADKYWRKKMNIIWWSMIMLGVILLLIQWSIYGIVLLWVVIWFGNNLAFWASAHILEEMDGDHEEDGSFIALERIILYIWYIAMPVILWVLYARWGFYYALSLMTVVVCALSVYMIQWTVRK